METGSVMRGWTGLAEKVQPDFAPAHKGSYSHPRTHGAEGPRLTTAEQLALSRSLAGRS